MSDEAAPSDLSIRERQKILILGAGVILIFGFADRLALGHFSWLAMGSRMVWAAGTLVSAWALPRLGPRSEARAMMALGVGSSLFFGWLVYLTGGYGSPLFHWTLVMPMVAAVVVQNHPRATLGTCIATLVSGLVLVLLGHAGARVAVEWTVQGMAMCSLAFYASLTYARLHVRDRALAQAQLMAVTRARELDVETLARHQAEAAVKARDEFLAVAAHELRTPLTSLSLTLQGLAEPGADGPTEKPVVWTTSKLQRTLEAVRRLNALLDELFDVARLAGGTLSLALDPVDLCEVTREVLERSNAIAARAGSALAGELPGAVVGRWDRKRLEQVLSNLVTNAVKYGRGQPVLVRVAADEEWAVVEVADRGIGIAPDDQARIFERFERAVSDRHYGGLGLGLWIVRQVVEALGGQVSVRSEPEQGSVFTVRLPREGPSSQRAAVPRIH